MLRSLTERTEDAHTVGLEAGVSVAGDDERVWGVSLDTGAGAGVA